MPRVNLSVEVLRVSRLASQTDFVDKYPDIAEKTPYEI